MFYFMYIYYLAYGSHITALHLYMVVKSDTTAVDVTNLNGPRGDLQSK